jgi:large repetitive protein
MFGTMKIKMVYKIQQKKELVDGTGKVVAATVTDASGKYLFTNVTPGNGYTVKFGQPIGFEPTTQSGGYNVPNNSDANPATLTTAPFNVLPGDSIPTLDAGFVKADPNKAALGNRVWYDNDNDGVQDAGETGVANVKVYLKDGTNTIIDSTQTDALGLYIFNSLDAGVYSVLFEPASLPAGYTFTSQNSGTDDELDGDESPLGQTGTYTLAAGDRNMSVDAGVVNLTNNNSLGDYVWLDSDKDGIQDPTEAGVSGVTATLYNNAGVALATTTTDPTGKYRFNGLPDGAYSVGFSNLPEAMGFTTSNAGSNDSLDSDVNPSSGKTQAVTLAGGQHNPTLDAGIYPQGKPSFTGTLGDVVWYDLNNNGIQEFGEVGVSDVVVTLFDLGPDGIKGTPDDGPSKYMYTDIQGNYLFTNLPASNYQVAFSDLPVGYTTSPQNATNSRDDSNVPSGFTSTGVTDTVFAPVVALGPGEDNLTIDAGIYKANVNSIGNFVWYDVDKDGIQDPTEQGVYGTEVLLLNPDGSLFDRDPLEAGVQPYVEITYNDGSYLFTNLPNGSYKVQIVNLDAGYVLTQANAGTNDSLDSDGDPVTFTSQVVTVTGGQFNPTLDFGIYSDTRAALGNYVWIDSNRDGLQDPNETPVPGVLVTLYNETGTPIATAVTDGNGKYLFNNLAAGTYSVGFTNIPDGTEFTIQDVDVVIGSDANPLTGKSGALALAPGTVNLTLDAGLTPVRKGGLGNYVWYDDNQDGMQDSTEKGVPGVTVTLTEAASGQVVGVASTDANGYYLFPNLDPDKQYIANFSDLPAEYVFTASNGVVSDALNSDADVASGSTTPATVPVNNINPNVDAGIYLPLGSIGNYVWYDDDGDGHQNEPDSNGINGVKVYLYKDIAGTFTLVDSTVTMNDPITNQPGYYLFDSLRKGNYQVEFPTIVNGTALTIQDTLENSNGNSDAGTTNGKSGIIKLDPKLGGIDKDNQTIDAGYLPLGSLGNYVWNDDNGNGLLDEPTANGITGVTVYLKDGTGTIIDSAVTGNNPITTQPGYYLFDSLKKGDYTVVFPTTNDGNGLTTATTTAATDSNSDANATTGESPIVSLDPKKGGIDQNNMTIDAGYLPLGTIGNYVWNDDNGNGLLDEPTTNGVNGVTVYLKDGTGTIIDSAVTGNNPITTQPGYYLFDSLKKGDYTVVFPTTNDGNGLTTATTTAATDSNSDANATTGESPSVSLDPKLGGINKDNPTVDAGYLPLGTIGNYVWNDDNGNGLLDEPTTNGINGVTVYLKDGTGTIIDSAVTGNNPITTQPGYYLFDSLKKGDYTVVFPTTNDGNGLTTATTTAATDSNSDANATTGESPSVSLDPKLGGINKDNPTVDAGYLPLGTIGNYVWNDDNGNGLLDEPTTNGINGVTVYLKDGTGTIIDSAVTGNNPITTQPGYYLFDSLKKGDYTVVFPTTNDGNGLTTATTIAATDSNSDANATTGESPSVSLDPKLGGINKDNPTVDAGYLPLGTIGNYVWNDNNGNGLLDEPTSAGINGVTVYLKDGTGTIIDSAVTANSPITSQPGYYLFDSLKKGDYTVVFPTNINGNPLTTPTTTAAADSNSDANTTTGESPVVSLDPKLGGINKDNPTVDAGYIAYGSIGNYVWYDDNADGVQNEPVSNGINGVTVYLLKDNGSGFAIVDSMVTANNPTTGNPGYYLFDSLSSGSYRVLFPVEVFGTDLTTTTVGFNNDSTSDANQATGETNTITINVFDFGTSKNNPTIDAGYVPLGSLGNRVWVDSNENGLYDEDSTAGINGVQVILLKENELGVFVPIDSMVTITDTAGKPGYYLFDRLPNGNYKVQFPPSGPGGLVLTGSTPTSQIDSNSDADSLTGLSPVITIINKGGGFNEKNPTIDAGYRPQAALAVGDIVLTATRLEKSDKLTWTLRGQDDYVSYEVYVGNALTSMRQISSLPANSANQYMFNNLDIASGILYYQVVGIDAVGNLKYSNTVNISRDRIYSVDVYPNPTTGNTAVHFGAALTEATAISVYDVSGKLVQQGVASIGTKVYYLDLSQLSSGIYTVTVGRSTHRVTKD